MNHEIMRQHSAKTSSTMMVRPFLNVAIILVCLVSIASCDAKVINAEASSSYWTKVRTGLVQSAHWIWSDYIIGKKSARSPRKVKLAIVGLGRTGSTSFSAALKHLGFAPIHDDEATEVSDIYEAMVDGSMSMDEVNIQLGKRGFDAPMVSLPEYVEWAATAPDVKVVLTVRDKSRWAQSWLSIIPAAFLPYQRPFSWFKSIQQLSAFNWKVMIDVPTNNQPELYDDIPTLEAGFEAWINYVKKTVPVERLLIFDVRQGWGPLCSFLNTPLPEGSFPHINDRVVVEVIIKVFVALTWLWPIVFALPLLVAYFLIHSYRRRRAMKDKNKQA